MRHYITQLTDQISNYSFEVHKVSERNKKKKEKTFCISHGWLPHQLHICSELSHWFPSPFCRNKEILFYRFRVKACEHSTCRKHAVLRGALNWKMLPTSLSFSTTLVLTTLWSHRDTFGQWTCSRRYVVHRRPFAEESAHYIFVLDRNCGHFHGAWIFKWYLICVALHSWIYIVPCRKKLQWVVLQSAWSRRFVASGSSMYVHGDCLKLIGLSAIRWQFLLKVLHTKFLEPQPQCKIKPREQLAFQINAHLFS